MTLRSQPSADSFGGDSRLLVREIETYPVEELPAGDGLWAVGGEKVHAAYGQHWDRLTGLCSRLLGRAAAGADQVDDGFVAVRSRLAALMTSLSAFSWDHPDGPAWNRKAEQVLIHYVPYTRPVFTGESMADRQIDSLSSAELRSAVRIARGYGRRGIVPHLLALGRIDTAATSRRVELARLGLRLATALRGRPDMQNNPTGRHLFWMSRFDLYRALGEENLAAGEVHSDQMQMLYQELTATPSDVPPRYRWRAMAFRALFDDAARPIPRSLPAVLEILLAESRAALAREDRECEPILHLNALVARGEIGLIPVVKQLTGTPGPLIREKSLLTADAAAKLRSEVRQSLPGLATHLSRELELTASHGLPFSKSLPPGKDNRAQRSPSQSGSPNRRCKIRVDLDAMQIWVGDRLRDSGSYNRCYLFQKLIEANGGKLTVAQLAPPEFTKAGAAGIDRSNEWVKDTLRGVPKKLKAFIDGRPGVPGRCLKDTAFHTGGNP